MTDLLVEDGWIAPAQRGPTRRHVVAASAIAIIILAAWVLFALDVRPGSGANAAPRLAVSVAPDGTATINDAPVETSLRSSSGGQVFLAIHQRNLTLDHDVAQLDVRLPAGVAAERTANRILPATDGHGAEVLVLVPAVALALPAGAEVSGSLRALTEPLDQRIRSWRADQRRLDALQRHWWWLGLLALGIAVAMPLWLWQRATRRFFSMRVPGGGVEPSVGPPSERDPVSVAAVVAGARPVDVGDAFAGHVLDLVARRQLLLRRTLDPAVGAGALLGLAHIDDGDRSDAAIVVLQSIAQDNGLTVALPDAAGRRRTAALDEVVVWDAFVDARSRFERLVEEGQWRRSAYAAGGLGATAITATIMLVASDRAGLVATATLVLALALPSALIIAARAYDMRRWRRVVHPRRHERAQWLDWARGVGRAEGPTLDPRNLPLLAAAGRSDGVVRSFAGPDAVGLDAVTTKTIATLRAIVDPD